ncbi:glycosyltransferase [Flavivirga amylovorans]|uniref:Glycosyltransferase n=1 Tax=Flavivirga amylovorans TaxID=870486 RepID=A0ABT8X620_9FLAO|nr:glycosyltransferase [Flavivirga amylovorans]MDO5989277.1 glycosyltransferase [Flavivirga amylovorans]
MNKLFVVFPISGPNNGVKIISNHIIEKLRDKGVNLELIDLAQAREFSNFGRFEFSKVIQSFKILLKILSIPRKSFVYINFTAKGFAYYRDLFFIITSKFLSHKITLHIHENGHENRSSTFLKKLLKNINVVVINKRQLRNLSYLNNIYLLDNSLPDYNTNNSTDTKQQKLLFFSNLSILKGIDFLCDFCDLMYKEMKTPYKLTICGGVLDAYTEQRLNCLLKKYNFIEYLGAIESVEEKKKIFQKHSLLLFTSEENSEVYPLVYIEALMFGLGIITTKQVVSQKVVRNGNGLIISEINKEVFSDINSLLSTNVDEKSRQLYLKGYSFEDFISNLYKIIFREDDKFRTN